MPLPRLELRGSEPHHAALRLAHAAIRGELLKTLERLRARKKPLPEGVPEAKIHVQIAQPCTDVDVATLFRPLNSLREHTVEIPALLLGLLEPHKQERLLKHLARIGEKPGMLKAGVKVECHPLSKLGADAGLLVKIRYAVSGK
ncbi:MAG: hypothetical protein AABW54_00460 [Candidatus Micrarchaeota archaeon]